jgi:hypothetical protein
MKRKHIGNTHYLSNIVTTGYTIEIGRQRDKDFMIVVTHNTRWQGSTANDVWHIRDYDTLQEAEADAKELLSSFQDMEYACDLEHIFQQAKDQATGHFSRPVKLDGHKLNFAKAGYVVN